MELWYESEGNNFQQMDMSNYLSPYRVQQVVKLIWNKKHRLRGDNDNETPTPPRKKDIRISALRIKLLLLLG